MSEGKSIVIGVPKETYPGETRVGLVPAMVQQLAKTGAVVIIEAGAGAAAGFVDKEYEEKGAKIVPNRDDVFSSAKVIVQVRTFGANPEAGKDDLGKLKKDQLVIGFSEPLAEAERAKEFAPTGAMMFALELVPRITRAQSMDALSAMATIAGYKAVLLAAEALPKTFPMFMTAAACVLDAPSSVASSGNPPRSTLC